MELIPGDSLLYASLPWRSNRSRSINKGVSSIARSSTQQGQCVISWPIICQQAAGVELERASWYLMQRRTEDRVGRRILCAFILSSYCISNVSPSEKRAYTEDPEKIRLRDVDGYYTEAFLLVWWVQRILMASVSGCLTRRWVLVLPEPVCALCRRKWCILWFGLGSFFHMFYGGFFFFWEEAAGGGVSKCGFEPERNSRGASLLDTKTVFLFTLSVLSWPQTKAYQMRKRTSFIICLLDWQSCMAEGRCRPLGMLQLSWQEIFPVRYSNEIGELNVICL